MDYKEHFKQYYRNWLQGFKISRLVEIEDNLAKLIDSDLFTECLLADEIIALYDIVRDECVSRLASLVATDD